jgi:hypothetical protein
MHLYLDGKGRLIINGAGNLALSKNLEAIRITPPADEFVVQFWTFQGCHRKRLRATLEALKWIWLR